MKALMSERIRLGSGILISSKATFLLSGLCHFYGENLFTDAFALLRLPLTVRMAQMTGRGNWRCAKWPQKSTSTACSVLSRWAPDLNAQILSWDWLKKNEYQSFTKLASWVLCLWDQSHCGLVIKDLSTLSASGDRTILSAVWKVAATSNAQRPQPLLNHSHTNICILNT